MLRKLLRHWLHNVLALWILPNSSVGVTPGSGSTFAAHKPTADTDLYQAVCITDQWGQIWGSKQHYLAMSDVVSMGVTAPLRPLAMFNNSGTGVVVEIEAMVLLRDISSFSLGFYPFVLQRITSLGNTAGAFTAQKSAQAMDPRNSALPNSLVFFNTTSSSLIGGVSSLWLTAVASGIAWNELGALWPPQGLPRVQWQPLVVPPGYGMVPTLTQSQAGNFRVGMLFAVASGP